MIGRSIVIALFLSAGVYSATFAQDISLGPDLSFGYGSVLFGFSGRYEAPIKDQFSWMGTAGLEFGSGVTLFTLQGGAKYTFSEEAFYLGAEIGPLFGSGGGTSGTVFGFTPTAGYTWDKFDLSTRFFVGSGFSFFNFRFAYVFNK